MKKEIQPWQQQPEEPLEKFQMFDCYLKMGEQRSQAFLAAMYNLSKRTITNYAVKYNWTERVDAYNNFIRDNFTLALVDYCKVFESRKQMLKIHLSTLSLDTVTSLKTLLENYGTVYDNGIINKRLKFLRNLQTIITNFMKFTDFSLSPEMLNSIIGKEIGIEATSKNFEEFRYVVDNENNNTDLFLNSITQIIEEKTREYQLPFNQNMQNDNSNINNNGNKSNKTHNNETNDYNFHQNKNQNSGEIGENGENRKNGNNGNNGEIGENGESQSGNFDEEIDFNMTIMETIYGKEGERDPDAEEEYRYRTAPS